jgi:hypothetical protein
LFARAGSRLDKFQLDLLAFVAVEGQAALMASETATGLNRFLQNFRMFPASLNRKPLTWVRGQRQQRSQVSRERIIKKSKDYVAICVWHSFNKVEEIHEGIETGVSRQ